VGFGPLGTDESERDLVWRLNWERLLEFSGFAGWCCAVCSIVLREGSLREGNVEGSGCHGIDLGIPF